MAIKSKQEKNVRLQLGVDSNFLEHLKKLAPQFRTTPSGLAADLLTDCLDSKSTIKKWIETRVMQFFSTTLSEIIQPSGTVKYLQVYLPENTAKKLESFAVQMGQTTARSGGTLLESALNDDKWIMETALRIAKGVRTIQIFRKNHSKRAKST